MRRATSWPPWCGRDWCTTSANGSTEPSTASSESAAVVHVWSSSADSWPCASTDWPIVRALLLRNANASDVAKSIGGNGCGPIQGCSPSSVNASSANAVRSPVPIAPMECTCG